MTGYDSTTDIVVQEARRRGIDIALFPDLQPNIVCLQLGNHREFLYYSSTDLLGRVKFKIFLHKAMTTELLRRGGFPVPDEVFTSSLEEAAGFLAMHGNVVIKPFDSVWGQGVTPGIMQAAQLPGAFAYARRHTADQEENRVICQRHIEGEEYRLLVVHQQHLFAVHRIPAHVVGDGTHTVAELVTDWNQGVTPERRVEVTERVRGLLAEQGWREDSVLPQGARVFLKQVANAHAGGIVEEAGAMVGEAARATALSIARYFDVPVVGVDCITDDISRSIGVIIELNSTPDFTLHHNPTVGEPKDVAAVFVDMLFPETRVS